MIAEVLIVLLGIYIGKKYLWNKKKTKNKKFLLTI